LEEMRKGMHDYLRDGPMRAQRTAILARLRVLYRWLEEQNPKDSASQVLAKLCTEKRLRSEIEFAVQQIFFLGEFTRMMLADRLTDAAHTLKHMKKDPIMDHIVRRSLIIYRERNPGKERNSNKRECVRMAVEELLGNRDTFTEVEVDRLARGRVMRNIQRK
jgi:hypothetical protein